MSDLAETSATEVQTSTPPPVQEDASFDVTVENGVTRTASDPKPEAEAKPDGDEPKQEATEEADQKPDEAKDRRKQSAQDRINELTAKRRDAERRAAAAERRAEAAEAKLRNRPDIPEDDWDAQQRQNISDAITENQATEAKAEAEEARKEAHQLNKESFIASVNEKLGDQAQRFLADFAQVPVSEAAAELMFDSPHSVELTIALTENPQWARQLAQQPPNVQIREIAKLEGRIEAARSRPPPKPKATQAPPPVKTISATASPGSKDPADMTDAEYSAWYRERQKKG